MREHVVWPCKGAFTGAYAEHAGLIRAAEGGTLFLDEIGALPLSLQPNCFVPSGGRDSTNRRKYSRKVNVRVVAATHMDLESAVKECTFREDSITAWHL